MKYLATLVLALFLAGPALAGGDIGYEQEQVVVKLDVNSDSFPWAEIVALASAIIGMLGFGGDHVRRKKQGKPSLAADLKTKLGK